MHEPYINSFVNNGVFFFLKFSNVNGTYRNHEKLNSPSLLKEHSRIRYYPGQDSNEEGEKSYKEN